MSKNVNYFNLVSFIVILAFSINLFSSEINLLIKAFGHIGSCKDNLAFYFKNEPTLKLISKKKYKNFFQEIYEVSNSQISKSEESIAMVNEINKRKYPFYRININEISNTIRIKISYDSNFVKNIIPAFFVAISNFKGINFEIQHVNIKDKFTNSNKANGKPTVILDFGHGGQDSGAIGVNNCSEKNIALSIGMKLKNKLEKENYNVFLTRNKDEFIELDKRTTMANLLNSNSVFVSIHANMSLNQSASGIETYYFDSTLLNKNIFKNNKIIKNNSSVDEDKKNKLFSSIIHESLMTACKKVNKDLVDRKLRKSVSQILLGSEMPTALCELGFLSNKKECELLSNDRYQETIANGIVSGIKKYFSNL